MHLLLYALMGLFLGAAAFVAAMLGLGGGSLFTPLQVIFGSYVREAAASSLFLITFMSVGATVVYRRARRVDWALAISLLTTAVAGGFAGGYLSRYVPENLLAALLSAALAFIGIYMLRGLRARSCVVRERLGRSVWHREVAGERYSIDLALALPLSFLGGVLSGLLGIGGGVVQVPLMAVLFGVPMDIAVATSAFMVGVTALGGCAGHFAAGHLKLASVLFATPAVIVGAWLGANHMLRTKKRILMKLFALLMFIMSAGVLARLVYKIFY